ncbi:MAG: leucine-rich repeat domain-containing protein [Muribaculaceae bacterium]|nr:leucine-rich repeat domain-containing protein [Muribaculaceae bacterium]
MKRHIYIFITFMFALITTACSEHSRPDNPEPSISISEAYDISRTEATIKATIERHGSGTLSYMRLVCKNISEQNTESSGSFILQGDPSISTFEFHLSNLNPGASYSCLLEAGTETASLKSNAITFTTIPNDLPKVSDLTILSTGPLGIIVKFAILDDGGEEIIAAGCEIKEVGNHEKRRIYATDLEHQPSDLQLNITGLVPSTAYNITPFASNSSGESYGDTLEYTTKESVVLTEPGVLAALFESNNITDIESITIAGPMNGDDFRTLRSFLGAPSNGDYRLHISDIDLTDVRIVDGGGSYDGQRFTIDNCISTGLFANCINLRHAKLPNSAISIERDAFSGCSVFETLTVPAGVEKLLPSSDCAALRAIEVSEANPYFISNQGVLLNADASEIIWFPCGKTGEYLFPSTISSIGENAFLGTSITKLIIPSGVTSISRGAFAGCSLTEIRLPDNLTNVSEGMFQNCSGLVSVYLGSATEYIGNFVFDGTSIRDICIAAEIPPYTMEDAFLNGDSTIFGLCTLHVPVGYKKLYSNHRQWGAFSHIEEFQP